MKTTATLCTALIIAFSFQTSGAEAKKPNILWLIAENIGPDLGCYGYPSVVTPNLDRLARQGMRYELAFSAAPMCSPSRSAFMTGMYQTTIGAQNHRSHRHDHFHLPDGVQPVTQRLAGAGYYTANIRKLDGKQVGTAKTDLNFEVQGAVLNLRPNTKPRTDGGSGVNSKLQDYENEIRLFHTDNWSDLKPRQPFFAQVNLPTVERNVKGWIGSKAIPWNRQTHPETTDPAKMIVLPYYPDHEITRKDWAGYIDAVNAMDARAGALGIYDLGGSVWEWCEDFFNADKKDHVLRSASWGSSAPKPLLSSFRGNQPSTRRWRCDGFRCVLEGSP